MAALLFWGVCDNLSVEYITFTSCCLQSIQQEYTSLLSCLIQTFPANPEFRDLVQLTNRHDPDMDFFENMKHMQVKGNRHSLVPLSPSQTKSVFLCSKIFQSIYVLSFQGIRACVTRYCLKKIRRCRHRHMGDCESKSYFCLEIDLVYALGALFFISS